MFFPELSWQSETPRLQDGRHDRHAGLLFGEFINYPGAEPPLRKVRCPPLEERHMDTTYFTIQNRFGKFIDCTEDIVLLARGPLIIGFDRDGEIRPIHSFFGYDIVYNEKRNKQYLAGRGYLRLLGVFGRVPPEIQRQREIHPFGLFRRRKHKSSRRSNSSSDLGSGSDSSSRSTSRSLSRSSRRSSSSSPERSSSRAVPAAAPSAPNAIELDEHQNFN